MKKFKHFAPFAAGLYILGSLNGALAYDWLSVGSSDAQPPKWDWQLDVPVRLHDDDSIGIYDIDMFDNESTGAVGMLHSYGKKVICYVDVGSWEDFRDDEGDFPRSILGNLYEGFPDERWLDIRDLNPNKSTTGTKLAQILEARFDRAKQMGCDAIEPDNMDVYDNTAHNPSGFPLSYEDNIFFNLWVAEAAHSRGMAIGMKNNINQAQDPRIVEAFDFVVSEECVQYGECDFYSGFLDQGKPVFLAEYSLNPVDFCSTAKNLGISAIKKNNDLDFFRAGCDDYYADVASANTTTAGDSCDYSDAHLYGGWGWNYELSQSCAPEENDSTTENVIQPTGNSACDYSDAHLFGGWGWNYELSQTCAPIEEAIVTPINDVKSCDYSDAHLFGGWGWNYDLSQSCEPVENVAASLSFASSCDYSEAHLYGGWGWNYRLEKSCEPL